MMNDNTIVGPHFAVQVLRARKVTAIPNSDFLDVVQIGLYQSAVRRGTFTEGQLVVYFPEQSIISPKWVDILVQRGSLPEKAAGANGEATKPFRVQPIKLRQVLSQGIVIPLDDPEWTENQDVTQFYEVTKYEPPSLPQNLACRSDDQQLSGKSVCVQYDIEHLKRFPDTLQDGEEVIFTEKLHGTWVQMGVLNEQLSQNVLAVTSKGLASRGVIIKEGSPSVYHQVCKELDMVSRVQSAFAKEIGDGSSIFVLGEIFGSGVQDLQYGAQKGKLLFRVFDIFVGLTAQTGQYLNHEQLDEACQRLQLDRVPVLYRGPFSLELVDKFTRGKETISGKAAHMREGIVIRPTEERYAHLLGRVQLKSVSEDYLLRKKGTEYN